MSDDTGSELKCYYCGRSKDEPERFIAMNLDGVRDGVCMDCMEEFEGPAISAELFAEERHKEAAIQRRRREMLSDDPSEGLVEVTRNVHVKSSAVVGLSIEERYTGPGEYVWVLLIHTVGGAIEAVTTKRSDAEEARDGLLQKLA